jgi:hypothetical protein
MILFLIVFDSMNLVFFKENFNFTIDYTVDTPTYKVVFFDLNNINIDRV